VENQVIIYSTSWCGFCHSEMDWFDQIGVKYTSKDIEQDADAMSELQKKTNGNFRGVPVTDIGGTIIFGFDRPKIQQALKENSIL
jgi:glutaredoxin